MVRIPALSDSAFLEEYKKGLSDEKIAKKFHVTRTTVWRKRIALGLPSHFPNRAGNVGNKTSKSASRK